MRNECRVKNRWCDICKNNSHNTTVCRKRNAVKSVENTYGDNDNSTDDHSFLFKIGVDLGETRSMDVQSILVDCGATAHIVNDRSKFIEFDKSFNPEKHFIELADGTRTNNVAMGKGTAEIDIIDADGIIRQSRLKDAPFVPTFKQNIFSVQAATENGASVEFKPGSAELVSKGGTKFGIRKTGKLYYLNSSVSSSTATHTLHEWHEILGHCNTGDIIKMEKVVSGMKITDKREFDCEVCIEGKMTQYRNREADERAENILDLVHCDLAGPIQPIAKDGFQFALVCVDDFSGLIMVYFLKHKSDAVRATEKFLADVAPYGTVKCIRSDGGGEFSSHEYENLLVKNHIKHEKSAPNSPHQNGTAERAWRTLFEMARCLLLEAELPKFLWTYAVMAAAYIRNRCFNPRTEKTGFDLFTHKKPNVSNMHTFGSVFYAYVQNKKKLDARGEKGVFVGYDRGSPAYLVYFPETGRVKRVRCVKFTRSSVNDNSSSGGPGNIIDDEVTHYPQDGANHGDENPNVGANPGENADQNGAHEGGDNHRYPRRENRGNPGNRFNDYVVGTCEDSQVNDIVCDYFYRVADIPTSYSEAMSSADSDNWKRAMEDEMRALGENDTFELTTLPGSRKAVGGKWVYTVKSGPNDEEKHKARYVAKGFSQKADIDFHETFSPTARITSIRTLLQIAVQNDLLVHQMDVKTAYLNAPIDCEIYMEQPEGFTVDGENGEKLVWKLKKSLYGLKQSGRNWNDLLHSHLIDQGFTQSLTDACVYSKHSDGETIVIIVWVDDLIIAASNSHVLKDVKTNLNQKFKMRDLGQLSWFLGIQFQIDDDSITMNQSKYIEKVLAKFGMEKCKPRSTPCEISSNKSTVDDSPKTDGKLYREMVGSLIYFMTITRPDLCYTVTKLSQHMANPTESDMVSVKHVFRYLRGTSDQTLVFRKSEESMRLVGFCDSDWGGSADRKSITGYGFQLVKNGCLISWKSKKQQSVALSTCEAEYMSLSAAVQEGKFLSQVLTDMMPEQNGIDHFILYCDNQGAIALAKNPVHHQRSKHIDIRYHFIRSELQSGTMELVYIPTDQNVADVFTKPVVRPKLKYFSNYLSGSHG